MNNTFNLKRFTWIFRKTLLERPVQIFGIIILNFILVLLLYSFMREIIGWDGTQNLTFLWGFVFGGCYLSAAVFNYFSTNANGSSYLTLPCSALEKWLCAILITGVLYTISFLLFFKAMDAAFVSYYHQLLDPKEVNYLNKMEAVQPLDLNGHVAKTTYRMYGVLVSAMMVGSLYFNKLSFIKTGLIICLVFGLLFVVNLGVANIFFNDVNDAFPFSHVSLHLPSAGVVQESNILIRPMNEEAGIELPQPYQSIFKVFIQYVLAAMLCVTAYIRLREKEF